MTTAPANRTLAESAPAAYQPLAPTGVPVPESFGFWRSRGYGWILALNRSGLSVFHVSSVDCSKDPAPERLAEQFVFRKVDAPGGQLILVQYPGENLYVFDRVAALPKACQQDGWGPRRTFEHFAATYREQYAFFDRHGFNWEERVGAARPLVTDKTSPRVLFAIFADMLDGLGDAHVGLNATFDAEPVTFRTGRGPTLHRLSELAAASRRPLADVRAHWQAAYLQGIRDAVLRGRSSEASDGRVVWGPIGNDIGYVNIAAVEEFVPGSLEDNIQFINALMDRIVTELAGVTSMIVDVTNNSGGYDRLAREIVGHFAPARTLAYTKRARGATGVEPDVFFAEPSPGRRFTGPTYLLTSDVTVSGGEILTLTMRVLPNVTQVGMPTRGALSDRLIKLLPNRLDFSISNETYLNPEGVLFEATGIPPHRHLEVFPAGDPEGGHAKAVLTLVQWIRAGTAGRDVGAAVSGVGGSADSAGMRAAAEHFGSAAAPGR